MTKKEMFTTIRAALNDSVSATDEMIQFIDHQIELISRPRGTSEKDKKKAEEREAIKEKILNLLGTPSNGEWTCGDLVGELRTEGVELSSQRVSAMLRSLIIEDKVIRKEFGGKSYFALPSHKWGEV